MYIEQLKLINYRIYDELELSFNNKINVIIVENAQVKANLMKAIYLLALTKFHRNPSDKKVIQHNEKYAKIERRMMKRNRTFPLEVIFTTKGKKAKLKRIEQQRLSDYIGTLNIVMFAPEDLTLVKGSPQIRRRFIDMELG